MSESDNMSDGTQCHECDYTHDDWSKDGQHVVSDPHNEGIIERYECGICGAITEVPRY